MCKNNNESLQRAGPKLLRDGVAPRCYCMRYAHIYVHGLKNQLVLRARVWTKHSEIMRANNMAQARWQCVMSINSSLLARTKAINYYNPCSNPVGL